MFFGSEGVLGVKVGFFYILSIISNIHCPQWDFLKATFPPAYPGSLPSYMFYDNNMNLVTHLLHTQDPYFDEFGLPADVFHAKTKHSATNMLSQTHCNPARFSELISEDDKWIFNSSAAEQTNVWFGGYQSIVREMTVPRCIPILLADCHSSDVKF